MAQNDILKRYLDAGQDFVRELVKAGEVQREQAEKWIDGLVERNRKQGEELVNLVRREVSEQLKNLGLEDLAQRARPAKKAAAKNKPVKAGPLATAPSGKPVGAKPSAPAKKAEAKKAAAKKAAVKKAAGGGEAAALGLKKAAPKKAPAKKAAAKKSGPTA